MAEEDWGRYKSAEGWMPRDFATETAELGRRLYANSQQSMLAVERNFNIYREADFTHHSMPLFGSFWNTKQVAVLFGEPGLGKSALAVQLAMCIATGTQMVPFEQKVPAHPVLYLDFEMTHRQFADRYTDRSSGKAVEYSFHENFLRGRSDWRGEDPPPPLTTYAEYLIQSLRLAVCREEIGTVIIDNISHFGQRHLSPHTTYDLLEQLRTLREKTDVSILLLAHTPKRRSDQPLTFTDLLGSVSLSGLADSVFAIGRSLKPGVRYIKHIKARTTEMIHDESNVAVYRLERRPIEPDSTTLPFGFTHIGFSTEAEQLGHRIKDKRVLERRVNELARGEMSLRAIGRKLSISHTSVRRILKTDEDE